jgi:hypothetical protein
MAKQGHRVVGRHAHFPPNILTNKARCLVYLGDFVSAESLIRDFLSHAQNADYTNWAMIAK